MLRILLLCLLLSIVAILPTLSIPINNNDGHDLKPLADVIDKKQGDRYSECNKKCTMWRKKNDMKKYSECLNKCLREYAQKDQADSGGSKGTEETQESGKVALTRWWSSDSSVSSVAPGIIVLYSADAEYHELGRTIADFWI
ncbi:hypothetical protein F5887DRAFT_1078775 [Amanita rubescens]|nr:hypothetical protein F5887DRAFT_1078775 [Amanita rubescens]